MEFADFPPEVVLKIVEKMDTETRQAFMLTNKGLSNFVKTFESSIAMARIASFELPVEGNVLSSSAADRRLLLANTFDVVLELELREARIDNLIWHTAEWFNPSAPIGMNPLAVGQQGLLVPLLKRAFWHCDAIADIAANAPCEAIPTQYYTLMFTGVWTLSLTRQPPKLRNFDPFTNVHARPHQIAYIRSLSLDDLAMLYYLIQTVGFGFVHSRRVYHNSDPTAYEQTTVFEECALRHGSWFLWSHIKGRRSSRDMAFHMRSAGLQELTDWEAGVPGALRGLKMTLMDRFRELAKVKTEKETMVLKMFNHVKRLVGLVVEEEEEEEEEQIEMVNMAPAGGDDNGNDGAKGAAGNNTVPAGDEGGDQAAGQD